MVAATVEHWSKGVRTDPRYLQFVLSYIQKTADSYTETFYPMYRCTDEDYDHFHTTETRSLKKVENLRKANEFFCFDWKKADFAIYGNWEGDTEWAAADIQFIPCESRWTAYDGTIHGGGDHCAQDKTETLNYLGDAFSLILLYNHGSFMQESFDEQRITKSSTLNSRFFTGVAKAEWRAADSKNYRLIDEIDDLQVGQQEEHEFKRLNFLNV